HRRAECLTSRPHGRGAAGALRGGVRRCPLEGRGPRADLASPGMAARDGAAGTPRGPGRRRAGPGMGGVRRRRLGAGRGADERLCPVRPRDRRRRRRLGSARTGGGGAPGRPRDGPRGSGPLPPPPTGGPARRGGRRGLTSLWGSWPPWGTMRRLARRSAGERTHARVAEWQTRCLQVAVSARAWGFKSPLSHHCPESRLTKGDSYDNAMAEALNSLFKAECIRNPFMRPQGGWKSVGDVEIAVAEYVDWYNHRRL